MSSIKELMSDKEKEEFPPFNEQELVQFLWNVREQLPIFNMKREVILRLFSTIAENESN